MEKIQETLHLPQNEDYEGAKRELVLAWRSMALLVNNLFTVYYQDDMPTIPTNTTSMWVDTNAGPKYYLVANFGGVIKKVELS